MIKSKLSYLVLVVMISGTLVLGFNSTQTSALGTINADVQAGDTYYYTVTEFPTFNEILDLTGASDGFNETNSLSIEGGLQGSQIYAKVMDTNLRNQTYWDGTQTVTTMAPAVDLSLGLITSQSLTIDAVINGTASQSIVPAGIGLPVPVIIGSTTMFNVSSWTEDPFLPLPLVLNDDFSLHELILTQASSQVNGTISVTNDASQFRGSFSAVGLDPGYTMEVNGFVSYSKPSGRLQEINFAVTNRTSAEQLFSIDIDYDRTESNPLDVQVGDRFELSITQAGFTYNTFGNNQTILDELNSGLSMINGNFTQLQGEKIIEFEVVEVRGMYYSIEGNVTDFNGGMMAFPEEGDELRQDLWMHGFGRLGPGAALPTMDPARTFYVEEIFNSTSGYYEDVVTDREVSIGHRALPGPFTSADYPIFDAWDNTLSYAVGLLNAELQGALNEVADSPGQFEIGSSNSDLPEGSLTFSSVSDSTSYGGWSLGANLDIYTWNNRTDNYLDGNQYYEEVEVIGNADASVDYNNTVLDSLSLSGNVMINVTETNNSQVQYTGLQINDFILEFGASSTVDPDVTETSTDDSTTSDSSTSDSTSDTSDSTSDTTDPTTPGGEETPQLPVPGFEVLATMMAVFGIGILVRTRRH